MSIVKPSEVAPISTLLLKHPREAWLDQRNTCDQWRNLGYPDEPDFVRACEEYDAFVEILRRYASEVRFLPSDARTGLDSIYVRDAACAGPQGIILSRMGKTLRQGEPEAVRDFCSKSGWPVAGEINAPGTLEGGDVVWLNEKSVAVGLGYRTNAEGIRQFKYLVAQDGVEVVEVPLPHWNGPGDILHLMSMISPVDERTALVYSRLLAVPFRMRLLDMGYKLLEVPDEEYATMSTNVLALAPGRALALAGNPRTAELLGKAGIEVLTYEGKEISVKGAGGPTCLTRPMKRSA